VTCFATLPFGDRVVHRAPTRPEGGGKLKDIFSVVWKAQAPLPEVAKHQTSGCWSTEGGVEEERSQTHESYRLLPIVEAYPRQGWRRMPKGGGL
jgi:hypothetical protein